MFSLEAPWKLEKYRKWDILGVFTQPKQPTLCLSSGMDFSLFLWSLHGKPDSTDSFFEGEPAKSQNGIGMADMKQNDRLISTLSHIEKLFLFGVQNEIKLL